MIGSTLHDFDLRHTRYVLDNIGSYLDDRDFASYVERQLAPPVWDHLQSLAEDDRPRSLLLNDREFAELGLLFWGGPFKFDRPWVPYPALHRRSMGCVREIREALAAPYAEEWARASARFSNRLVGRHLRLGKGIEVVRDWVSLLRSYLRALGATALLPYPEGLFPTPTCPQPLIHPSTSVGHWDTQEANITRMLNAIAELGPDAKADHLIRTAGISRKQGRDALRELQERGQYKGFARARPYRYQARHAMHP